MASKRSQVLVGGSHSEGRRTATHRPKAPAQPEFQATHKALAQGGLGQVGRVSTALMAMDEAGRQRVVVHLQRLAGNAAVQQLAGSLQRDVIQRPSPATSSPGAVGPEAAGSISVQRWHDDGHEKTTAAAVPASLVEYFPKFAGDLAGLKARLADASLNMDRFFPQKGPEKESHNIGRLPTLAAFVTGMAWSQAKRIVGQGRSRGLFGEGANHGEAGMYTQWSGAEAKNQAREDEFIDKAVAALKARDYDTALNRLGDASHVAADRGSHGEGHKGRGHDTPMPPPGKTGYRFTPLTQQQTDDDYDYMEGWADNDDLAKNTDGYTYGLEKTKAMFERFLAKAPK